MMPSKGVSDCGRKYHRISQAAALIGESEDFLLHLGALGKLTLWGPVLNRGHYVLKTIEQPQIGKSDRRPKRNPQDTFWFDTSERVRLDSRDIAKLEATGSVVVLSFAYRSQNWPTDDWRSFEKRDVEFLLEGPLIPTQLEHLFIMREDLEPLLLNSSKTDASPVDELSGNERSTLQKQAGTLALVLAHEKGKYKYGSRPNASQIASAVDELIARLPEPNTRGLSSAAIRHTISEGFACLVCDICQLAKNFANWQTSGNLRQIITAMFNNLLRGLIDGCQQRTWRIGPFHLKVACTGSATCRRFLPLERFTLTRSIQS